MSKKTPEQMWDRLSAEDRRAFLNRSGHRIPNGKSLDWNSLKAKQRSDLKELFIVGYSVPPKGR